MQSVAVGEVTFRMTLIRSDVSVVVEDSTLDPAIARGGMEASAYLAKLELDPEMAAAMRSMRKQLAMVRTQNEACSLSILRMRAGLSQAQLATAMETSQPNIARWEKDPEQMTAKSIRRMANVLQVKEQAIHDAMQPENSLAAEHAGH